MSRVPTSSAGASTRFSRVSRPAADARTKVPCVLAIGGLDPGGGAGVLADARAILRAGAFPCAALAVETVQSTSGLVSAHSADARRLRRACEEVLAHQHVRAFKTGALGSAANTRVVSALAGAHPRLPLVVDTVLAATRGRARLLDPRAMRVLREELLPRTTLATVNALEAGALLSRTVTTLEDARAAAISLLSWGPLAVLVKGGHLAEPRAVDLLATRHRGEVRVVTFSRPRIPSGAQTHGGGCVLASLVAARLALAVGAGERATPAAIEAAIRWAKPVHHRALRDAADVGGGLRVLLAPR